MDRRIVGTPHGGGAAINAIRGVLEPTVRSRAPQKGWRSASVSSWSRFALAIVLLTTSFLALTVNVFAQSAADAADSWRRIAAQDRKIANSARERAQVWEDMARKARARAAASSGAMKKIWEENAVNDEKEAKKLNDEADAWEEKARAADAKAEQALSSSGGGYGPNKPLGGSEATAPSPADTPRGPEPPATTPVSGPEPATTTKAGSNSAATDIPLAKLLGTWIDEQKASTIKIEQSAGGQNLFLKGKHSDWTGSYTPASGSRAARMVFRRKPSPAEMDQGAPEWARNQVRGKLEWILDLEVESECGLKLKGTWYRGEVRWRDDGNQKTGSAASHVSGVPLEYEYLEDLKPQLTGRPSVQVVTRRDFPWPAETLDKEQSFFVEVRLDYEAASKQGKSLKVKFEVEKTGKSLELALTGTPHKGPVIYTSEAPVLFERPFDIAGPSDLVHSPYDSPNLAKLGLKNGDVVKVSFRDSSTSFKYFDSWVQQGIARNEDGFLDLLKLYQQMIELTKDLKQRERLHRKSQLIVTARHVINDYHPEASADQLTDLQRYYIGNAYHYFFTTGLTADSRLWELSSKPYLSKRFGVMVSSMGEEALIFDAIEEGRKKFKEDFYKSVPAGLSLGAYHIVAQLSGGGMMWTAVAGINESGQPVDLTDRIFAGVGFASGALFTVASPKMLTDLSPSARGSARGASSGFESDRPSAKEFEINPDTRAAIKRSIEAGGAKAGGAKVVGKIEANDINLARQVYGPNAVLRTPAPGEPGLLQVRNYNCVIEVARFHILKGTGRSHPEQALRSAAAIEGHVKPGEGMMRRGYVFLVEHEGGRAWLGGGSISRLKSLVKAGYFIEAYIQTRLGGQHSVDFRGFVQRAGVEHTVFGDPYFGSEVLLPTCDFLDMWAFQTPGKGDFAVADFGQATPVNLPK